MASAAFEELKKAIGARAQKEVAASFCEQWKKAHPNEKAYAMNTCEAHLSRTVQGEVQGLRWFFGDGAQRGELLLDLLEVEGPQREAIVAEAERRLQDAAGQRIQYVVDVASIAGRSQPNTLPQMFAAIRTQIVQAATRGRVLLLLTPELLDYLSVSLKDRCEVEEVADAAEARKRVLEEVKGGAIAIAGELKGVPPRSWVACWRAGSGLQFEPPNWEDGLPDEAAEPTHFLDEIARVLARGSENKRWGSENKRWIVGPDSNGQLVVIEQDDRRRDLYYSYSRPEPIWSCPLPAAGRTVLTLMTDEREAAKVPWPARLDLAEQYGGRPVSTAEERAQASQILLLERVEAAAKGCGGLIRLDGQQRRLETELARARRRRKPATFLWEGKYHFANPGTDLPAEVEHSGLAHVYRWPEQPSALQRIRDATASWTELDWRADPQLEALIKSLDADGSEEPTLVHAAATLLRTGALKPQPDTKPADAAQALRAVLEVGFVPAALLLAPTDEKQSDTYGKAGPIIGQCPVDWLIRRGEVPGRVDGGTYWHLPKAGEVPTEEQWIKSLEVDEDQPNHFGPKKRPFEAKPLAEPSWDWLDEQLAFALLSLRDGLRSRDQMVVSGGRLLVRAGGGLFASVLAVERTNRRDTPPVFAFRLRIGHSSPWDVLEEVTVQPGNSFRVPHRLTLEAAGYAVTVGFIASELHAAGARAPTPPDLDDDDD